MKKSLSLYFPVKNEIKISDKSLMFLNPNWVTGLTDAECSFIILISKSSKQHTGWKVQATFSLALHNKDQFLLEAILKFFDGIGAITKLGSDALQYRVTSIKDLLIVINHFDKFPLITKKRADYILFKMAVEIIINKRHLTAEGLKELVSIKASINRGLSEELKVAFPNVIPAHRPLVDVEDQEIKNSNWLAGFISGEGCFFIKISKSKTHKMGSSVQLKFQITQHIRDEQLLLNLKVYFGCGEFKIRKGHLAGDFFVYKLSDLTEKIIPLLKKYPIAGIKTKDFEDFSRVAELMKNKKHLTQEGLKEIEMIKYGMNRNRMV